MTDHVRLEVVTYMYMYVHTCRFWLSKNVHVFADTLQRYMCMYMVMWNGQEGREIGRAHGWTPVTATARMAASR